jgi:arsenate reductase
MSVTIYHNPRCSKSRQTLALLEARGIDAEIVLYLDKPPDASALSGVLKQLKISALALMRTGEDDYKRCRDKVAAMNNAEQITWLIAHPNVIERPIVVTNKGARIGRPPESVLEILD